MTLSHLRLDDARVRAQSFEARAVLTWSGQVVEMDGNMAALLGRGRDDVAGTSFLRHVVGEDRATFRQALTRGDATRRWRLRLRCAGGLHEVVAMVSRPSPDHDDVLLAVLAGDDVAQLRRRADALARANAAKQAVIDSLQEVLVAQPRAVPGLAVRVRHASFDMATTTSGDAADVLPIDDHRCHVALMDVTGHGAVHTAQALLLVQTLRVLALEDTAVDDVLAAALPLVRAQDPALTASGVVGRYDARTGVFRVVGAGAPPLVLCRADGTVEAVDLPGAPLGFDVGPRSRAVEVTLTEGDRVVLVTDGVLGRDLRASRERVMRVCASPPGPTLDDLVGAILRSGVPGPRADDATVLAMEHVDPGRSSPRPPTDFETELQQPDTDVASARLELRRWLRARDLPASQVDDSVLIMSELCSNAVRVARTSVTVRAEVADDHVMIEVRDDGPGLPQRAHQRLTDPRGAPDRTRGLFLVTEIADDLFVATDRSGTVIRAWCR